jgi:hypothetical protein
MQGFIKYPYNSRPDWGVDWAAVCSGGKKTAVIPDMTMGCGDECVIFPKARDDRERNVSLDEFHYRCEHLEVFV